MIAVHWGWSFFTRSLPDFIQAAKKLNWTWAETFSEFKNVLPGGYKTAWWEVMKDHFSPSCNNESNIISFDTEDDFQRAVQLFVCTIG